eukprot:m.15257 g.15257  ORF g.15257 m.15257 type:complete len:305 (-) comp10439_c0_seq1:8620-9534(-)
MSKHDIGLRDSFFADARYRPGLTSKEQGMLGRRVLDEWTTERFGKNQPIKDMPRRRKRKGFRFIPAVTVLDYHQEYFCTNMTGDPKFRNGQSILAGTVRRHSDYIEDVSLQFRCMYIPGITLKNCKWIGSDLPSRSDDKWGQYPSGDILSQRVPVGWRHYTEKRDDQVDEMYMCDLECDRDQGLIPHHSIPTKCITKEHTFVATTGDRPQSPQTKTTSVFAASQSASTKVQFTAPQGVVLTSFAIRDLGLQPSYSQQPVVCWLSGCAHWALSICWRLDPTCLFNQRWNSFHFSQATACVNEHSS